MQDKAEKFTHALGEIIKHHRELTGKSVYKISAEASIPKTTWLRIEKGVQKDLCLTSLWKIAYGLDIKPDILIKELREKLTDEFDLCDY